jgi:TraY domain
MKKKLPTGRKPGTRPRRHKYKEGTRVPLSLRITPDMKTLLDQSSERAGRSQSAEVEIRMERSDVKDGLLPDALYLRLGGMGSELVLDIVAAVEMTRQITCHLTMMEEGEWLPDDWLRDPRCLDGMNDAIARVLARFNQPPQPNAPRMIVLKRGEWHRVGEAADSWVPVVREREKAWRVRQHEEAIEATKATVRNEFNRPLVPVTTERKKGRPS